MKLLRFLVCQRNHLFLDGFYWFIMSKVVQKKNHWTTKVNECTICKDARGELNVQLLGGAENGEFAYIGPVNGNAIQYRHGKVSEGELLLEVETLSVSGLPLYDVLTVIKNCKGPIRLKTVRQGKQSALISLFFSSCDVFPVNKSLRNSFPRNSCAWKYCIIWVTWTSRERPII